jgi:F0F1-type ATP synthase membrane subunit b/b'
MPELMQAAANFVDALAILVKMISFPLMVWLLMKAIRPAQRK